MSKEVTATGTTLPALVTTPALDIGAEDVALPKLKIGSSASPHVQDGLMGLGDIYTITSKEDPDPILVAKSQGKGKESGVPMDDGPRFYVLGMRKGKSVSVDGELQIFSFDDPDAPSEAWVTYNYAIAIPSLDAEVPISFLLTRSGMATAKNLNTILKKNEARGPVYELAFRLGTAFRENAKGRWYVAQIRHVEADPTEVEVAARLADMVNGANAHRMDVAAQGNEPSI